MLGKVIAERYLLVEKIGQGGSGTIYRGEHTTLHKKVAVKMLHAQLSPDDTALERFRREATTVGRARQRAHPAGARLTDAPTTIGCSSPWSTSRARR